MTDNTMTKKKKIYKILHKILNSATRSLLYTGLKSVSNCLSTCDTKFTIRKTLFCLFSAACVIVSDLLTSVTPSVGKVYILGHH